MIRRRGPEAPSPGPPPGLPGPLPTPSETLPHSPLPARTMPSGRDVRCRLPWPGLRISPIVSSTGLARSTAMSSPPMNIGMWPRIAPPTEPFTGRGSRERRRLALLAPRKRHRYRDPSSPPYVLRPSMTCPLPGGSGLEGPRPRNVPPGSRGQGRSTRDAWPAGSGKRRSGFGGARCGGWPPTASARRRRFASRGGRDGDARCPCRPGHRPARLRAAGTPKKK